MFPETYPWMVNTDNDLVFVQFYTDLELFHRNGFEN